MMKIFKLFGLGLALASVGCAGARLSATEVAKVNACAAGRSYDQKALALIQRMRDDGAGLNEVAATVGGTRADVRCVELVARASRQGWRAEVAAGGHPASVAPNSWLASVR
jgi:hypothetical protein